jgi:energy-coupling factor transporter ATP-binding protein EcfA2
MTVSYYFNYSKYDKKVLNFVLKKVTKKGVFFVVDSPEYKDIFLKKIPFQVSEIESDLKSSFVVEEPGKTKKVYNLDLELTHLNYLEQFSKDPQDHSQIKLVSTMKIKEYKAIKNFNCKFIPGFNVLYGENAVGKTSIFKYISETHKIDQELFDLFVTTNEFLTSKSNSVVSDFLINKIFNLNYFNEIKSKNKQEILDLTAQKNYFEGQLSLNTQPKETVVDPDPEYVQLLKVICETEKKSKAFMDSVVSQNESQKKKNIIKGDVVRGIKFTDEFDINSVKDSKIKKFLLQVRKNSEGILSEDLEAVKDFEKRLNTHTLSDHSQVLEKTLKQQTEFKVHKMYVQLDSEETKRIQESRKECVKSLEILKTYKKSLVSRIYQKEILEQFLKGLENYINKSGIIQGNLVIDTKKMKFGIKKDKLLLQDHSNFETVVIELLIRCWINKKYKISNFICIDESIDCFHDVKDLKTIVSFLKKNFEFVLVISHRPEFLDLSDQVIHLKSR